LLPQAGAESGARSDKKKWLSAIGYRQQQLQNTAGGGCATTSAGVSDLYRIAYCLLPVCLLPIAVA
jgi:hypothetical protein